MSSDLGLALALLLTSVAYLAWLFTPWHKRGHGCGGWTRDAEALVAAPCYHKRTVPVDESATGDILAHLCLDCDEQLPAGFVSESERLRLRDEEDRAAARNAKPQEIEGTPADGADVVSLFTWGSSRPVRAVKVDRMHFEPR